MGWKYNQYTGKLDYYLDGLTGVEIVVLLEALAGDAKLSHDSGLSDVSINDHHNRDHAASHHSAGVDELNHDNLAGFVAAEHLSLPNTIANVLSDHDKAAHDALGLSHDSLSDVSVNDHHAQLHAAQHVTGGGDVVANAVPAGNAGLMTGADKTKLNGVEALADVTDFANVQAALAAASGAVDFNSQNLTNVGTIGCGTITTTGNVVMPEDGTLGAAGLYFTFDDSGDKLLLTGGNLFLEPVAAGDRYVLLDTNAAGDGKLIVQAGGGSAGFGGAINLFSHSHATKPGWVTAGISSASGGLFTVNTQGLAGGADVFTVDAAGNTTLSGDLLLANGNYVGISGAERLEFYTAGYAAFMGCKVGIGTATPASELDVRSGSITLSGSGGEEPHLNFSKDASTVGLDIWSAFGSGMSYIDNKWDSVNALTYFRMRTGGVPVEAMVIKGDGKVGIGTDAPTSPDGIAVFLEIQNAEHVGIVLHETEASGVPWEMYVDAQILRFVYNTADYMWIDASGSVDIIAHDAATVGLKLGGVLVTSSAVELNYSGGVTSAVQTQLDARCLESVFGTAIGAGLLLDGTDLKTSAILQKYHAIDPSANVQTMLGSADNAAILSNIGAMPIGGSTFTGAAEAADHGAAATDQIINVCYGTGDPPAANTTTIGTLYIKYVA